ncbi:MAG: ABC transporter permease, partial [Acidobacteriota bacterium]
MSMPENRDVFARKGVLSFLVDAEMASTIREDLEYQRLRDRQEKGPLFAALRHAVRLAATVGPLIIYAASGGFIMIGNSIKMARRNLAKDKGFSFINIAGLALGMSACLFLILWVQDELSFDAFQKNAADIFRVDIGWALTPYPLAPAAGQNIPEIETTARQAGLGTVVLRAGENAFYESRAQAVDPSFLRIFSFPLLQGNPETALNQPHSLILTESQAKKYFGP